MARDAFNGMPVVVKGKTPCAEGYTLIQFHVISYDACRSYHDACSVVNGEVMTNLCSGVNVNARLAMGHFCQHTRDEWYSQFV